MPKKNFALEDVAPAIQEDLDRLQRGLDDIRQEMVTKLELHDTLHATEERILRAVEKVRESVQWNEAEADDLEAKWNARFHSLEQRIERLEKKR